MRLTTLFICIILSLTACKKDGENLTPEITTQLIAKGDLYGNGAEGIPKSNRIIKDADTWNKLLDKINSVNTAVDASKRNIDFNQFFIIAVFDQVYGNGGHSIDITGIEKMKQISLFK